MTTEADTEPLDAILLREMTLDRNGRRVDEDAGSDPASLAAVWAIPAKRDAAGAPAGIQFLGRCRLQILSANDSAFVAAHISLDTGPDAQFIRARLTMDGSGGAQVRGGDLVAVPLAESAAIIYEVLLDASELPPIEPGALELVSLPAGEAVLMLRADLGLIDLAPAADAAEESRRPHATH